MLFLLFIILESGKVSKTEGENMNAGERIRAVRMIEKMEKNAGYCEKLGIKNVSVYHGCGKGKNRKTIL